MHWCFESSLKNSLHFPPSQFSWIWIAHFISHALKHITIHVQNRDFAGGEITFLKISVNHRNSWRQYINKINVNGFYQVISQAVAYFCIYAQAKRSWKPCRTSEKKDPSTTFAEKRVITFSFSIFTQMLQTLLSACQKHIARANLLSFEFFWICNDKYYLKFNTFDTLG